MRYYLHIKSFMRMRNSHPLNTKSKNQCEKAKFIIVIVSVLLQYFFGKHLLYYYNSYNLFY